MYGIAQSVIDRVAARRGTPHAVNLIEPARSALIVVDMQNYFLKPGYQGECAPARAIVGAVNRAAQGLRGRGGTVVWIQTASDGADRDWSFMHGELSGPQRSRKRLADLAEGSDGWTLWPELDVQASDLMVTKRRYSCFIQGSSPLEGQLRARGIDTVLISGTTTNVCCESTARDAMMLNFRTVMLADALAAPTPGEHASALTNCLLYFGDVMNVDETIERMAAAASVA